MKHSNISDFYFYSGLLLQAEYLLKIRKAMSLLRHFTNVVKKLEKNCSIEFGNPHSAVLPIAELISRWPSLGKKYSKVFEFSEWDFRNILVSLSREGTEDEFGSHLPSIDSISFQNWCSSARENSDNVSPCEVIGISNVNDAIHSLYLGNSPMTSASRMEKAIRWTLYKVNLGFDMSIDPATNQMVVVLDSSKPRRSWEATSKMLQRKKNIPKNFGTELVQCESLVKDVIENHLPDVSKIIKHSGHVVMKLPFCFQSGWPHMIANPRKKKGRTTEFIFLDD